MNTTPDRLLRVAERAVLEACAVCRAVQTRDPRLGGQSVGAITKGDSSPVTIADFAAQAVIAHRLRQALGEVTLLGEEGSGYLRDPMHAAEKAAALAAVRLVWPDASEADMLDALDVGDGEFRRTPGHHGAFWTLDPIDGTKGFLRGEQYAVCLAYVEVPPSGIGIPTIAAMGCPNLPPSFAGQFHTPDPVGLVYLACRGRGASVLPADGSAPASPLRRAPRTPGAPILGCRSVDASHSDHSTASRAMRRLNAHPEPLELDSQCKYAVVARGQADVYLRIPGRKPYVERIWDHASGALIASESGCAVTDIDGKPLDFGHGRGLDANRGIVCADPSIHRDILDAIAAEL